MSVVLINERGSQHCAEPPLSNLVDLWRTPDVGPSLAQTPTSSTSQYRSQRCFSQFDRKTDCFDGGCQRCLERESGQYATCESESKTPPSGEKYEIAEAVRLGQRCAHAEPVKSRPVTFKAVCGTQTRHGGPVNKNQPDSQQWQKTAIGPTACLLSAVLALEPTWIGDLSTRTKRGKGWSYV